MDRLIIEALQEHGREWFRRIASKIEVTEKLFARATHASFDAQILQVIGITNPLGLGFCTMALTRNG
jgi:hypothetical protein